MRDAVNYDHHSTASYCHQIAFVLAIMNEMALRHLLPINQHLSRTVTGVISTMTKHQPHAFHERSPQLFRLVTLSTGLFTGILGLLSAYWLAHDVFPLLGRMYRNAPIVVTPYLGFMLIAMCMATPILVITSVYACWHAKKFDPPPNTHLFRFQHNSYKLTLWSIIYIAPALALLATLGLWAKGYTPCPKLLISGSAWQVYWVNDERYCFKPDSYTRDGWPCKRMGDKNACLQVDGRQ